MTAATAKTAIHYTHSAHLTDAQLLAALRLVDQQPNDLADLLHRQGVELADLGTLVDDHGYLTTVGRRMLAPVTLADLGL